MLFKKSPAMRALVSALVFTGFVRRFCFLRFRIVGDPPRSVEATCALRAFSGSEQSQSGGTHRVRRRGPAIACARSDDGSLGVRSAFLLSCVLVAIERTALSRQVSVRSPGRVH